MGSGMQIRSFAERVRCPCGKNRQQCHRGHPGSPNNTSLNESGSPEFANRFTAMTNRVTHAESQAVLVAYPQSQEVKCIMKRYAKGL
jgi:hypothetical protein